MSSRRRYGPGHAEHAAHISAAAYPGPVLSGGQFLEAKLTTETTKRLKLRATSAVGPGFPGTRGGRLARSPLGSARRGDNPCLLPFARPGASYEAVFPGPTTRAGPTAPGGLRPFRPSLPRPPYPSGNYTYGPADRVEAPRGKASPAAGGRCPPTFRFWWRVLPTTS